MYRSVFYMCLLCGLVYGLRARDKQLCGKIKKTLVTYKNAQDDIYTRLEVMEDELYTKINETIDSLTGLTECPTSTSDGCKNIATKLGELDLTTLESRLDVIEDTMDEIMGYLSREKETDIVLKQTSGKLIQEMKGKVEETDQVIVNLGETVVESLDNFETMIQQVNRSAQVTINSKGVVFLNQVGSICSLDGDCLTENSECRSHKCQCLPGWSYNMENRNCVETCDVYGVTYQIVDNYIIRGHNTLTVNDVASIEECIQRCNTESGFLCKTIDYFPRWKDCYLSEKTKLEVPDEAYEYNSAGIHLQRDCE